MGCVCALPSRTRHRFLAVDSCRDGEAGVVSSLACTWQIARERRRKFRITVQDDAGHPGSREFLLHDVRWSIQQDSSPNRRCPASCTSSSGRSPAQQDDAQRRSDRVGPKPRALTHARLRSSKSWDVRRRHGAREADRSGVSLRECIGQRRSGTGKPDRRPEDDVADAETAGTRRVRPRRSWTRAAAGSGLACEAPARPRRPDCGCYAESL